MAAVAELVRPNFSKKVIILRKTPQAFNTTHQRYGAQQKYYQGS